MMAAVALVAACGGGDDEEAPAAAAPGPSGNQAPTISGSPPGSIVQGAAYSFTPAATDANNDTLTFAVTNLPQWATFNTATGAIGGTPTQIGTHANILITVSDGQASAALGAFTINVVGTASGAATLSWTPPTQNQDGSALTDLAGYRIYWGTTQGSYPNSQTVGANVTSYMVEQLTPATWYFVATAFDAAGNESQYSNVASKTIL